MPLWGIYIPKFGIISVKFSVSGVMYPYRCTSGVKFGLEEWTFGPLTLATVLEPNAKTWSKLGEL